MTGSTAFVTHGNAGKVPSSGIHDTNHTTDVGELPVDWTHLGALLHLDHMHILSIGK